MNQDPFLGVRKCLESYKIITKNDGIMVPKHLFSDSKLIKNIEKENIFFTGEIDFSEFDNKTIKIFLKIIVHLKIENNQAYNSNFWDQLDIDEESFIELIYLCEKWDFIYIKKLAFFYIYLPRFYKKFNFKIINRLINYHVEVYYQEIMENIIIKNEEKIDTNNEKRISTPLIFDENIFKNLDYSKIENVEQIKHICFGCLNIFLIFIKYFDLYSSDNLTFEKLNNLITKTNVSDINYYLIYPTRFQDFSEVINLKIFNCTFSDIVSKGYLWFVLKNIKCQLTSNVLQNLGKEMELTEFDSEDIETFRFIIIGKNYDRLFDNDKIKLEFDNTRNIIEKFEKKLKKIEKNN